MKTARLKEHLIKHRETIKELRTQLSNEKHKNAKLRDTLRYHKTKRLLSNL